MIDTVLVTCEHTCFVSDDNSPCLYCNSLLQDSKSRETWFQCCNGNCKQWAHMINVHSSNVKFVPNNQKYIFARFYPFIYLDLGLFLSVCHFIVHWVTKAWNSIILLSFEKKPIRKLKLIRYWPETGYLQINFHWRTRSGNCSISFLHETKIVIFLSAKLLR